jgi:dinuclear metal center YbgI/SA1388 family protein
MPTVAQIADFLEEVAPTRLAAEWDNVGLLLGERGKRVERLMTCLTVTPESAEEAISSRVEMIVSHHPIFFRPVQRLTDATPEGRMLLSLAGAGLAVYSPHTAFDNVAGGINEILAQRLGLVDVKPLRVARPSDELLKLVVFVPEKDLGPVSDALFAAGAGHIGEYSQCSFRFAGTGTFFGSEATSPSVGKKGQREEVAELRLEVVCPADRVGEIVAAMRKAHSYEEPAFDIYRMQVPPDKSGEGRVGQLPKATTLSELACSVKQLLRTKLLQHVGDGRRSVRRVAIACGAGGSFVDDAAAAGADVLLTGEARFHESLAAQAKGLALILPGHYATERPGVEDLASRIQAKFADLSVWASRSEGDPLESV